MNGRSVEELLQLRSVAAEDAEHAEQSDAVQRRHAGNARVAGNNFVFFQLTDQRLFGVLYIFQKLFGFGQQRLGFDFHEGRRHTEVFARLFHVDHIHRRDILQILVGYLGNEDILDLDLRLLDEVEQQIERPFEVIEFCGIIDNRFKLSHQKNNPQNNRIGKPR